MSSQSIRGRHDQNFIIMEDEATMSHKYNQKRVHTHFSNKIDGTQLGESVVVEIKGELAHEDNQKEVEEEHSDAMLTKLNEEAEPQEILLRKLESKRA